MRAALLPLIAAAIALMLVTLLANHGHEAASVHDAASSVANAPPTR